MAPQRGSIEAQGLAENDKIGQKIADLFRDLPDIQVTQAQKKMIILPDVTKLGKECYGRIGKKCISYPAGDVLGGIKERLLGEWKNALRKRAVRTQVQA